MVSPRSHLDQPPFFFSRCPMDFGRMPISSLEESQCLSIDEAIALESDGASVNGTSGHLSFDFEMDIEPTAPLLPFSQLLGDAGGRETSPPVGQLRGARSRLHVLLMMSLQKF